MSSSQQELPTKRHFGAMARQVRLFSLDSHGNTENPVGSCEFSSSHGRSRSSSAGVALELSIRNHPTPRTERQDLSRPPSSSASSPSVTKRAFSPRFAHVFKSSGSLSSEPSTDDVGPPPLRAPSKLRWEQLRQHVVASTTPIPPSPVPSHRTNTSGPTPTTPKASRFARLGLRQVADHVREATVDDSRMLADDILRLYWFSRPLDARSGRQEREGSTGTATSLTLPLIPNAIPNADLLLADSSQDLSRPAFAILSRQVLELHDAVLRYASRNVSYLPHEHLVLAILLKPFLTGYARGLAEEERWTAVEAFETAVKIWQPASAEMGIERCIWCCSAARQETPMRPRIIGILNSLLRPRTGPIEFRSPGTFVSLIQSLLTTLVCILEQVSDGPDADIVKDLIAQLRTGNCGSLASYLADVEVDGIPVMLDGVKEADLRDALVSEALIQCCKFSPPWVRTQVIAFLDEYWRPAWQPEPFSPLLAVTHTRKLNVFSDVLLLIASIDQVGQKSGTEVIVNIVETRVNKELVLITGRYSMDVMKRLSFSLLEVLCLSSSREEDKGKILALLTEYLMSERWRPAVESSIQKAINCREWPLACGVVEAFFILPEIVRASVFSVVIPALQERLVIDPPSDSISLFPGILERVSRLYPQLFFKPFFSCAASSKELSVVHHLQQVVGVSALLPDIWLHDPDMIVVALMNEVGDKQETHKTWGRARLGRTALLVELIMVIRALIPVDAAVPPSNRVASANRFFSTLETRLGVMLDVRERTVLIPQSQRLLLSVLLRHIRLLTRSLKRSSWLSASISWLLHSQPGSSIDDGGDDVLTVDDNVVAELLETTSQLEALYRSAQEAIQASHQRRSTMLFPNFFSSGSNTNNGCQSKLSAYFTERAEFLSSLPRSLSQEISRLLVMVSPSLTAEDHGSLGPFLWKHCLHDAGSPTALSAAFLIMQCAERATTTLIPIITSDLQSRDDQVKVTAIRRFYVLIAMRFQILSEFFIQDRNHRRLFRSARDPLPFVATSIGSSLFAEKEEEEGDEGEMSLELRKRLAEVGWLSDKESADKKRQWTCTPVSLLPLYAVDRVVNVEQQILVSSFLGGTRKIRSNSDVSDSGLSTRTTDSAARSGKRRAVFVPQLAALFPLVISMASEPQLEVASTARDCILHVLRDDPALLLRPAFDLVVGNKMDEAATAIRGLLHLRHVLPPAATHYIFNHLMGFLKWLARETNTGDPLLDFAMSSTLLTGFLSQVSEMSLREIRRAKVEPFLLPTGSLWFHETAPVSALFPRSIAAAAEDSVKRMSVLAAMTVIRLSQNRLFLALLQKHPKDVQGIRKSMKGVELPCLVDGGRATLLTLNRLVPSKAKLSVALSQPSCWIGVLSSLLSRSYLLLTTQIFKSMSPHISERNELATFIDGINRILLAHSSDIGIVAQGLIGTLMVAGTRFRRLFISGGGYPLFMLAIFKLYAEQEGNEGIRTSIEYAANRFYALHQETFLFQMLDVVAHAVMTKECDDFWTTAHVHQLLSSLRYDTATSLDYSGIRDSTKLQEKEALMVVTAEENPQVFINSTRRPSANEKKLLTDLPEEYASVPLPPENVIRLLLTVIAHDPSAHRAQRFLRLLRLSVQTMYNVSKPARNILRDGIDAIGNIVTRVHPKSRNPESTPSSNNHSYDNVFSEIPDIASMQLDFLRLVLEYIQCGGHVLPNTSQKFFEITRLLLREACGQEVEDILSQYSKSFLNRTSQHSSKEVTVFLEIIAPIIRTYGSTVDFAGVYEAIIPILSDDRASLEVLIERCTEGLLPHCTTPPAIHLMTRAVYMRGVDIVAEIVTHPPTYQLTTCVLIPFILSLDPGGDNTSSSRSHNREVYHRIWLRLLSYSLKACQSAFQTFTASPSPERRKSQDKRRSGSTEETVMSVVAALQALKVICVKGAEEISLSPGIWTHIATVLKSLLADGDASFAFGGELSAPPSPVQSPHHSIASFDPFTSPDALRPSVAFDFRRVTNSPSRPRLVDYLLWSLLEKKLVVLMMTYDLIKAGSSPTYENDGCLPSFQSRVNVPLKQKLDGPLHTLDVDISVDRKAGFERSPSSPGGPSHLPQIVHLGPTQLHEPQQSASTTGIICMHLRNGTIKSPKLIHATYRRIRLVQASMGYDLLLPIPPGMEADEGFDTIKAWTKKRAVEELVREMEELTEEFLHASGESGADESMIIVDPDESALV
ncbi:hypothetical protein F5J12DRAFT_911393 [Pisolithus orientalis]|uniref:uncharacterized protein n=1 Tax=Pisolithus orientalis TaxID=936130 RepID=UPI002224DE4B|nr:uncharacterized protein F5J12DRAFT_911393 [Pisolithus orientalis]KAI6019882.1 hypothetical protein F5J12DRAFT_911393 [Pisolithus orientalis]